MLRTYTFVYLTTCFVSLWLNVGKGTFINHDAKKVHGFVVIFQLVNNTSHYCPLRFTKIRNIYIYVLEWQHNERKMIY